MMMTLVFVWNSLLEVAYHRGFIWNQCPLLNAKFMVAYIFTGFAAKSLQEFVGHLLQQNLDV